MLHTKTKTFLLRKKEEILQLPMVKENNIQGYLAYHNNKVVGWYNANTKLNCFECQCGKIYIGSMNRKEKTSPTIKVKSVFCFAIAPEMRGKGIAGLLLKRVCQDGFDFAEAYPNKEFINAEYDYMEPPKIYERLGFTVDYEIGPKVVMRKKLK